MPALLSRLEPPLDAPSAVELVACAEREHDQAAYERAMLGLLRGALDFEVGFFVRSDTIGAGRVGLDDALVPTSRRRVEGYGRELAPVLQAALAYGVVVDREVMGARLERTRLFREFIAPHRGHSTALVPLCFRGQVHGLLALGRRRRGFGHAELSRLHGLVPVLRVCEASRGRVATDVPLTPRERDVLDYLCLGYSNPQIAQACETSVHTVRNQLRAVFRKLGASSRAEAVALALRGTP